MQINKKAASIIAIVSALGGVAGSIAIAAHAQTSLPPVQPAAMVQSQDTDNIQAPGGVEVPDTKAAAASEANDQETNDDQNRVSQQQDGGKDDATEVHHFNTDPAHEANEKDEGNAEETVGQNPSTPSQTIPKVVKGQ